MKKTCPHYWGIECIDGSCPLANEEEYIEHAMDLPKSCEECPYNNGCDSCSEEYCAYREE